MAQKVPASDSLNIPYEDLASEVTRRRSTMFTREETSSKKSCKAKEGLSNSDSDSKEVPHPSKAYPTVPPAPPPSPAEDSTDP
ncbi:myocilin opposite strand protein [Elephas maximus indicus]|uniref:myocilin opposite strand protein n=1 Tax=Elephas maximus indicus TaxID=99487 RepID=UPI002116FAFE|nr:myocilin opposite strand protein [Elephas maximus indicus]